MAKINIQNMQLPTSASVKYTSVDGTTVLQSVPKKTTAESTKELKPGTYVNVTVFGKSKKILYESGHKTLAILQEGGQNDFGLNWV